MRSRDCSTNRTVRGIGVALLLLVLGGVAQARGPQVIGKVYYTRANIWWDRKDQILSTNYHSGKIIPAGTKVFIEVYGRDRIGFSIEGEGGYVLVKAKHSKRITLEELFRRYFADRDPLGAQELIHTFTKAEQRNIADGTLAVGMRKDAVLMAYGYPPSHKTPKLSGNKWTYWTGRMGSFTVVFGKDDKVVELPGYKKGR